MLELAETNADQRPHEHHAWATDILMAPVYPSIPERGCIEMRKHTDHGLGL
jgi:hypothetical protein